MIISVPYVSSLALSWCSGWRWFQPLQGTGTHGNHGEELQTCRKYLSGAGSSTIFLHLLNVHLKLMINLLQ